MVEITISAVAHYDVARGVVSSIVQNDVVFLDTLHSVDHFLLHERVVIISRRFITTNALEDNLTFGGDLCHDRLTL